MDLASLLHLAQNNLWATAAAVFLATTLVLLVASALAPRQPPLDLDSMGGGMQVGEITPDELAKHDGRDPFRPIYLSIKGTVYDVTPGRSFYGPGGGYAAFAGKECARAFALVSTDVADCVSDVSGLGALEMDNLRDWRAKFEYKYPVVGKIVEEKKEK